MHQSDPLSASDGFPSGELFIDIQILDLNLDPGDCTLPEVTVVSTGGLVDPARAYRLTESQPSCFRPRKGNACPSLGRSL